MIAKKPSCIHMYVWKTRYSKLVYPKDICITVHITHYLTTIQTTILIGTYIFLHQSPIQPNSNNSAAVMPENISSGLREKT